MTILRNVIGTLDSRLVACPNVKPVPSFAGHELEHVPKKLRDFFDPNMLQISESERFLFDQMIPSDREALSDVLAEPPETEGLSADRDFRDRLRSRELPRRSAACLGRLP